MTGNRLLVMGGSGFIGRHLLARLSDEGHHVTALVRSRQSAERLASFSIDTVGVGPSSDRELASCFDQQDAAINLVGILHETPSNTFEAVHEKLPLRLLRHCQTAGVPQYIHMSALPASAERGPSRYLYSRGKGEDAVHQHGTEVAVTSLRPSVVFGPNDHFFFSFAAMLRWMPVLPLACPNSRFAPVFVGDVVEAILRVVAEPQRFAGNRLDLCGPEVYTLRELIEFLVRTTGRRCFIVGLPDSLARLQGMVFGALPKKIFTLDNYLSLQVDSLSKENGFPALGITPRSLGSVMEPLLRNEA